MVSNVLRRLMTQYRLSVAEVAEASGLSSRSVIRLRAAKGDAPPPRSESLRRVADAIGDLTHLDSEEVYREMMLATGRESHLRQGDMGIRGAAELASHYQRMSPVGRHILLEQARLLARELPGDS